jgi:uncharacterized protein YndB with AHSA1/START domain
MSVHVSVDIDAPPERVWAVIEPIERHVDWMADAVSITFRTERHRGVGTAFECLTKIGPFHTVDHMVITEWEPARAMGVEHRGVFTGRGRFSLEPIADGRTRFSWTEAVEFPWYLGGALGAAASAPVFRRVWLANLHRLAGLVASAG